MTEKFDPKKCFADQVAVDHVRAICGAVDAELRKREGEIVKSALGITLIADETMEPGTVKIVPPGPDMERAKKAIADQERRISLDALGFSGIPTTISNAEVVKDIPSVKEMVAMVDEIERPYREARVRFTSELHRRLHVQARNLLLEYRLGPKTIHVDRVHELMELYGNLIAEIVVKDQAKVWSQAMEDMEWATKRIKYAEESYPDSIGPVTMAKVKEIRKRWGL
jgi:hypothetical protein